MTGQQFLDVLDQIGRELQSIRNADVPDLEKNKQLEIQQRRVVRLCQSAVTDGILRADVVPADTDESHGLIVWEQIARALEPLYPGSIPRVDTIADSRVPILGESRSLHLAPAVRIGAWIAHALAVVEALKQYAAPGRKVSASVGDWSAPMSKTEIAKRITCRNKARYRGAVQALVEGFGVERVTDRTVKVRLDTMDANTRRKLEKPA